MRHKAPSHATAVLWSALTILLLAMCIIAAPPPAQAQDGRPTLAAPATLLIEPGKDTLLAITLDASRAPSSQTFLRIRGLPAAVKLSDGQPLQPGTWAVPLSGLPNLKISAPVEAAGRADLVASLVTIDGDVLAEARTQITIAPLWLMSGALPGARPGDAPAAAATVTQTAPPVAAAAPPPAPKPEPPKAPVASAPAPAPVETPPPRIADLRPPTPAPAARPTTRDSAVPSPVLSPLGQAIAENARRFLGRGNEQLAQGNVQEARLFLRRAAELGSAEAAMMMASTFDAYEIKRMHLFGPKPDANEARLWYERAKELGAADAERLLARLDTGTSSPR